MSSMPYISGSGVTIESPDIYSKYNSKYNGGGVCGNGISQRRSQSILKFVSPPSKKGVVESSSSFMSPQNNQHFGFGDPDTKSSSLVSPPHNPSPIRSNFWRTAAASKGEKNSQIGSSGTDVVPEIYGANVALPSPDPQSKYFEGTAPVPQSPTYNIIKQPSSPSQLLNSFSPTKYYSEPTTPTTPYSYPGEEDDARNCSSIDSPDPLSAFHCCNQDDCNDGLAITAADLIITDVMEQADSTSQEKPYAVRTATYESHMRAQPIKKVLHAAAAIYSDDKQDRQEQDLSVYDVPVLSIKKNTLFMSKENIQLYSDPRVETFKGLCVVPSIEVQISPTAVHDIFSCLSPGGDATPSSPHPSMGPKGLPTKVVIHSNTAKDFLVENVAKNNNNNNALGVFSFQLPVDSFLVDAPLSTKPLVPQKPMTKPAETVHVRSGRRFVVAGSTTKGLHDNALLSATSFQSRSNDENAHPNIFQSKPAAPPAKAVSRTRGRLQDARSGSERSQLTGDGDKVDRVAGSKQSRERKGPGGKERRDSAGSRSSSHSRNQQGRSHTKKKKGARGKVPFDPSKLEAIPEEEEGVFGVPSWLTVLPAGHAPVLWM